MRGSRTSHFVWGCVGERIFPQALPENGPHGVGGSDLRRGCISRELGALPAWVEGREWVGGSSWILRRFGELDAAKLYRGREEEPWSGIRPLWGLGVISLGELRSAEFSRGCLDPEASGQDWGTWISMGVWGLDLLG